MQQLIDFKRRHKFKSNDKLAAIFGYSGGHVGNVMKGRRRLTKDEQEYFENILRLYDAGQWAPRQLTKEELRAIRKLYDFDLKKDCAEYFGFDGSHWSKMEAGTDQISMLSSCKVLLRLALDNKQVPESKPAQPVQVVNPTILEEDYFAAAAPLPAEPKPNLIRFDVGQVRTELIASMIWFALTDVCNALDYTNPANARLIIEPGDLQKIEVTDPLGRPRSIWFVNEPGLYQFLLASNVPKARPFKKWITHKVVPAIRKNGSYSVAQAQAVTGVVPDWASALLQQMGGSVVQLQQQVQAQGQQLTAVSRRVEEAADPDKTAEAALKKLQELEAHKSRLHDLVHAIVGRARTLPADDPDAAYYREFNNTWRTVHRYANPPVSKIAGYTSAAQIEHAVLGAEAVLARLGGTVPAQQLELEVVQA